MSGGTKLGGTTPACVCVGVCVSVLIIIMLENGEKMEKKKVCVFMLHTHTFFFFSMRNAHSFFRILWAAMHNFVFALIVIVSRVYEECSYTLDGICTHV